MAQKTAYYGKGLDPWFIPAGCQAGSVTLLHHGIYQPTTFDVIPFTNNVQTKKLKPFLISLLLLFSTSLWSQTGLGIGLVSIDFDDKTVLAFYTDTVTTAPEKVIEFFDDKAIKSWSIKNLEEHRKWLQPETLWLDYSAFTFRCLSKTDHWLEVIVNNETQTVYWLKKTGFTQFKNWEAYLKGMFSIERRSDHPQKIRTEPFENAKEIAYQGKDCFVVKSMSGDWIEIATPGYCSDSSISTKKPIKSGWVRWRSGSEFLIYYFRTS